MTRRLLVRLVIAAGSLAVLALAALTVLVFATSAPQLPPPPLPTVTAQPGPSFTALLRIRISANPAGPEAQTGLTYVDPTHPQAVDPPCTIRAHWSLTVNPQDAVGRPYAPLPNAGDWARAAAAVGTARSLCPVAIALAWVGHDPARPTSDRWMVLFPSSVAAGTDGPALRRYALRHAHQL